MERMSISLRPSRHINRKVSEFGAMASKFNIALEPTRVTVGRNTQIAQSLKGSIENHCRKLLRGSILTGNTLHASSPVASMLSTGNLDEVNCQVDGISCVVDRLAATLPDIVLVPAIAGHSFILLARVSEVLGRRLSAQRVCGVTHNLKHVLCCTVA